MKRLVRLYPRAWRDRYGAELEALLAETPTSPTVVADVLTAAGRARGRAMEERLRQPQAQRVGAWAAMAGGTLWAAAFLVGWMVDWGRYGRDLGFQILAVLAGLLVIAQLTEAVGARGRGHAIAWLGALIGLLGGVLLVAAVVAAIVLEPPLVVRLPLSPSDIWDRAMLLVMVGAGVSAVAFVGSRRSRGASVGAIAVVIAAAVLAVALFVPFEADVRETVIGESGQVVAFFHALAPVGWFVSTPLVVAAGVVFGAGWAWIGRARLHEIADSVGHRMASM